MLVYSICQCSLWQNFTASTATPFVIIFYLSLATLKPVQIEKQRIQRERNGVELLPLRKGKNVSCLLACFSSVLIMYIVSEK